MPNILKKIVESRLEALSRSQGDFASVYRLTFSHDDDIVAETSDGLRIVTHTAREVRARCEAVSAALYSRIGATHQYVGLEMENCLEWIIAFWAILRSGNKPYLINCRHPRSLSDSILKTLRVRYIVGLTPTALEGEYLAFGDLCTPAETDREPLPGDFENELALSTSATTMKQTICFYTGREVCAQLEQSADICRANSQMYRFYHGKIKQLAFLPFYHVYGLFAVYFWFGFFGVPMVFLRDYAPETILKTCRKHEVTHIFAVPMLWHTVEKQLTRQLAQEPEKVQAKFRRGAAFSTRIQNLFPNLGMKIAKKLMAPVNDRIFGPSLQCCISGGSYLRTSALELLNALGYPLRNGYGMSETGITSVELGKRPRERNTNSIGKPLGTVEFRLDEEGVCQIRGKSLSSRIMVDGVTLENKGWLETGDLLEYRDGTYFIKGRRGDLVIGENGENINPDLIEQQFTLPDAKAFSVLGLEDGQKQENLALVVQMNPYFPAGRVEALAREVYRVNETLPLAMQIRQFYFSNDDLSPKTAIKVSRTYLRRGIEKGTIALTPFADYCAAAESAQGEEDSPLAARIRAVVGEVLDLEPGEVGMDAHIIYDLGASSLQYFEILTTLGEEFSLQVSGGQEESCRYTVREICKYIEEHD